MANSYTTKDLVNDVLLLGHVPLGQNTFDATKILRLADMELQTPIMKQILSTRGGYYMTYDDVALNADGLYPIPADAIAGSLANVEIVSAPSIIPVHSIDPSEQFSSSMPMSGAYGFYIKGNHVQVMPSPTVGVLRMWYSKRTSKLIETAAACQVTAIGGVAGEVISVSAVPATITAGKSVDALGDQPPFNIIGENRPILLIAGTDITFALPIDGLEVGDWLALHKQTCIPQIPVEFRILLAQRVVCKIYELQNYTEKLKNAEMKLREYEANTLNLITPRVKSQTKIISSSHGGFLSGSRRSRFVAG